MFFLTSLLQIALLYRACSKPPSLIAFSPLYSNMHRSPPFYTRLKPHRYFSTKPPCFFLISCALALFPHLSLSWSTLPTGFKTHKRWQQWKSPCLLLISILSRYHSISWDTCSSLPWLPWSSCILPLPLWSFIFYYLQRSHPHSSHSVSPECLPPIIYTRFQLTFHKGPESKIFHLQAIKSLP